jgi:creatinine amidohydrolase
MPKAAPYLYAKLTWPEINDAVAAQKVCIVPIGSIEQHGPHLPLDVDCVCPTGVAMHAAELLPDKVLILPTIPHGYTGHVVDYPGTINIHYQHFIESTLDVVKSLAYHGFKKIVLLNGHGSNMPNLDLVARRANLETDAECVLCGWWNLLSIDKDWLTNYRESYFPGGCAHACELETSVYMYLDPDNVRMDLIADGRIAFNEEGSVFHWIDLLSAGPAPLTSWTSSYSESGVLGAADLATPEKGKAAVEEAARQLARLATEFGARPKPAHTSYHLIPPTMPVPWGTTDDAERGTRDFRDVIKK